MRTTPTLLSAGLAAVAGLIAFAPGSSSAQAPAAPAVGATRVAQWQGDRKGAFLMMFDDACPSHVKNVIPELKKRNLAGTFYIVPNKGEYKAKLAFWETEAPAIPGIVYGNHTFSHQGFTDPEQAEKEIAQANDLILKLFPGKSPRLISYAAPGGVKSAITGDQLKAILAKHNLIPRPTFQGHGAAIQFKTADDILKGIDNAMADGGMEHVIFHGVGGDWISFDLGQFTALLNGLETRRDALWITDPVSVHKYETERGTAKVAVAAADARQIRLDLTCGADAALYDQPLTLVTRVPAAWAKCLVAQRTQKITVAAANGEVRFDARPNAGAITLTPQ